MSTTRKLTKAEELALTTILTEGEKSRQSITDSLNTTFSDSFFIANVCARAFTNTDRYKNILCEIFSILKPDFFSNLYEELLKLLTKAQVDSLFLTYTNASTDVKSWVIAQCRKDKDYTLLHNFVPKFLAGNKLENGCTSMLLIAVHEVPLTDKSRIDTIKKLVKENVPFDGYFINSTLKTFDHAVDLKDYEVIKYMTEVAITQESKENIQHIANGIARAIADEKTSSHCNEAIKAVNSKLNPQTKDVFFESLRKSLTKDQANKYFLAHINDTLPSEMLNLLMYYGINDETYIQAIETCADIKNAEVYLNQFLEQKPQTNVLKNAIRKVINRSENSKDWRLADALASKIISGNEDAYGDLLLTAAKSQQKEIVRKLIKANAKLNWHTSPENKYALHFMIDLKWNDVIEEMLKNTESMKLLASGIAHLIIYSSNDCMNIIEAVNSLLKDKKVSVPFYEALHVFLTQEQADHAFTSHVSDRTWPILNMLMDYRVSPEALMKNIETTTFNDDYPTYIDRLLEQKLNVAQFTKMLDVVFTRAKKNGNLELIEGKISKKMQTLLEDAEGIKFLTNIISQVILNSSDHCIGITKIVETLIKEKSVSIAFYEALHASLTQQQADEAFIKHVSDKTWPFLNILMGYRLSPEALIKNIETTAYLGDSSTYLDNLLEQKLDVNQFTQLMNIAIARSKKQENWSLIDKIVSKQLQIPGSEKIYGKALLAIVQANKPKSDEIITKLINVNTSLDEQSEDTQNTALHLAAARGDCQLVFRLVNAGASIDIKNKDQQTCTDLAIKNGHYYLAAFLKSENKDKLKSQQDKFTIDELNILYGMFINDDNTLQAILDENSLNISKDEKNEFCNTRPIFSRFILDFIKKHKKEDISKNQILIHLLQKNILKIPATDMKQVLTYQDDEGNTALHQAATNGTFDLIHILLNYGANPNKSNIFGETSLSLAEKNQYLSIAKLLKTDPATRAKLLQDIGYAGGFTQFEQNLQKKEQKIKRTAYAALTGDHIATQEAINYYRDHYKYGRLIILSAIGAMYSKLDLQLTSYQSEITGLKVDDLSWLRNGVSFNDKQKLTYLQEFFSSNLDALCEYRNQEKYKDLDPFTLILLVMKQKLKDPTHKQIITKHKIESSIRSIMRDELGMSPEDINQQMDRSKYIVDKILGLNQPELKQHAGEKESDLLRAALHGEVYGLRRMVDIYYEDTRVPEYAKFEVRENLFPRHGRLMLFSAVIAPFVSESDQATYLFYLKSLNLKTMLRTDEKIKVLSIMKKFYLYSFEISKSLKQHYNVNDPFMLIFLVLEYASKYKKFSATEIKIINDRLKESLNSAMVYEGGYTKAEIDKFITEKEIQVTAIIRSHPLEKEDKLLTSIETLEESITVPVAQPINHDLPPVYIQASAPPMSALPPAAILVTSPIGASSPPLAQVVHSPKPYQEMLPPVAVEVLAEELTQTPMEAIQIAEPKMVVRTSNHPSALFAKSTKLSAEAAIEMEYFQVKEHLLDAPPPPDFPLLEEDEDVTQSTSTMKMVVN